MYVMVNELFYCWRRCLLVDCATLLLPTSRATQKCWTQSWTSCQRKKKLPDYLPVRKLSTLKNFPMTVPGKRQPTAAGILATAIQGVDGGGQSVISMKQLLHWRRRQIAGVRSSMGRSRIGRLIVQLIIGSFDRITCSIDRLIRQSLIIISWLRKSSLNWLWFYFCLSCGSHFSLLVLIIQSYFWIFFLFVFNIVHKLIYT